MLKIETWIVVFLLLISSFLLSIGINKPFIGHHDYNNRFFSQAAKYYLTLPISGHKFGQVIGRGEDGNIKYYTHHPILLPLALAGSMTVFGDQPWAVRLVPIIFSAATVVFFYRLLQLFFDTTLSLISTGFWMLTPMFLYFGKMANHEALTLFFIVFSLYHFIQWQQTGSTANYRWSLLGLFVGQWAGWPAYYLAGVLFLFSKRWVYVFLCVANFLLFILHVTILTGSPIGGGLGDIFLFRAGLINLSWAREEYSWVQFIRQELSWLYHFFNPIQVWLAGLGVFFGAYKSRAWFCFFFVALIHVLLFRTGAWRHDYWLYYFLPVLVFGVAMGLWQLLKLFPRRKRFIYLSYFLFLVFSTFQGQPFFWALQSLKE